MCVTYLSTAVYITERRNLFTTDRLLNLTLIITIRYFFPLLEMDFGGGGHLCSYLVFSSKSNAHCTQYARFTNNK